MEVINAVQRSDEWFAARRGVPTASCFDKIITADGKPSKQRTKYMYQLAGERIAGVQEPGHTSVAMQRGIDMESEARQTYEFITGETVEEVGFCKINGYGCSPDGLVGEGGLEIKCPLIYTHVEYLLGGVLPADYFQQVQGSMLVTGRKWWDFMSYYPGLRPLIVRVERDDAFCGKLEKELGKFCDELNELVKKIGG